jgi:hypothetical protein
MRNHCGRSRGVRDQRPVSTARRSGYSPRPTHWLECPGRASVKAARDWRISENAIFPVKTGGPAGSGFRRLRGTVFPAGRRFSPTTAIDLFTAGENHAPGQRARARQ